MVLAGSFSKYLNGVGMESRATDTMLISSPKPIIFQAIIQPLELRKNRAANKAVNPVSISQFLPSKVICSGNRL